MKMNRRNALLGLGAVATGGGALFGSGAFSQVQADRTMTVGFSSDSTAELTLNPTSTYATTTSGTGTNGQNLLKLEFTNLNDDAQSTFTGVFDITNNDATGASHNVYIKNSAPVDGTTIDFRTSGGASIVGSGNAVSVTNGSTLSITVYIDSTNSISSPVTVSIVAN